MGRVAVQDGRVARFDPPWVVQDDDLKVEVERESGSGGEENIFTGQK